MPLVRALAVSAVLVLCGGCSMGEDGERAELPAADIAAPCAVTAATPPAERPAALAATTIEWFGRGGLWVGLPDYPPTRQGDTLVLKFPVVTLLHGVPTASRGAPAVAAVRADAAGEAPGQVGGSAEAFGTHEFTFWPAAVTFPAPGCWTITSALAAESVQFTVSVREP